MTSHYLPIVQGITNAISEIDEKSLVTEGCRTALRPFVTMGIIIDASGLIPLMKYYIRLLLGAAALNIKPIRCCAMVLGTILFEF